MKNALEYGVLEEFTQIWNLVDSKFSNSVK